MNDNDKSWQIHYWHGDKLNASKYVSLCTQCLLRDAIQLDTLHHIQNANVSNTGRAILRTCIMANTPPPGIDLNANQQGRLVSSMIALIILPTAFVILRLVSRRVSRAGYWVRSVVANYPIEYTLTSNSGMIFGSHWPALVLLEDSPTRLF